MSDNGKQFVSWEKIAGGFGAICLLVMGTLIGWIMANMVPQRELNRLVVQADQTHIRMDARDDAQDAQIRALMEGLGEMKMDIARIRALMEERAKRGNN